MDRKGLADNDFAKKLEQFLGSNRGPAILDNKEYFLQILKDPKVMRAVLQGRLQSDFLNLQNTDKEKKATDEERSKLLRFLHMTRRSGCPDPDLPSFIKLIEDENLPSHYAQFFLLMQKISMIQIMED